MNKSLKIFTATAVTASAIMPVAVSADSTTFFDVETTNAHFDAITSLVERGIIKGYADGTYRPNASLTRGQAAKILANTLKLDTSSKEQIFTDVPATLEYVGAINALAKAGIINGYEDGTFKPSAPLTRGQMAKIIVKAYKLQEATELNYSFTDLSNDNGFNYYIQTLLNYGITQGTTATTFAPTEAVKRGQMASFVVRAEKALAVKPPEKELHTENDYVEKPTMDSDSDSLGNSGNNDSGSANPGNSTSESTSSESTGSGNNDSVNTNPGSTGSGNISSKTITGNVVVTDDKVTINGKKVVVPNELQSFFSTNKEALTAAQMKVEVKNNTITKITSLTLNASDTPDSLITFNGAGATIKGDVKINTAQINIKNLNVDGDVSIAHTVEAIDFNAVDVKGTVITEEVPATARFQRIASLAMFAATENPVTKLKITFADSTVAYMEIKKKDVSVGLTGTTTVTTVSLLADGFILEKSNVILPKLTISKGVTQIQLNASIASVEVESNNNIAISGSGNFASVVVKTKYAVSLETTGTIGQLASDNQNVTLGTAVKVRTTTSTNGEDKKPEDMISNYGDVKDRVNVDIIQEEFIKYIAAKTVQLEDKFGYVTLSVINAENATIKYRSVSNYFDNQTKPAKVGDQAPADAIIYNTGDQFIRWDNTRVEVYKVDKNNKVLDVVVAEEDWRYGHKLFDLKYEDNRFTVATIFNVDAYEKSRNEDFLLRDVMLIDGINTYEFEEFKELTWSKDANGMPIVSFDAPANFVYNADNYGNLYIDTNYYITSATLNERSYTKDKAYQTNVTAIKSFLEKTNPSFLSQLAYESALRSLGYEMIYEYNESGGIMNEEYIAHYKEDPFVKEEYKKALAAQNIETAEQVLATIKDVNERLKEKSNAFEAVAKDVASLFVEDYHEYPLEEQLAADVTLEKIKATKEKLSLLVDGIGEINDLSHRLEIAEGLYNRFVLKIYDFEALEQALIQAEAMTEEGYSKADWDSFTNAIKFGRDVMNRGDIKQQDIDHAVKYIEDTFSNLRPISKSVEMVDFTAQLVNETGSINLHNLYYNDDKDSFQQGTIVTINGQSAQFYDSYQVTNELGRQGYRIQHQQNENGEYTGVSYISKNGEDVTVENVTSDTAGVFTEIVVDGQKQIIFNSSKFVKHIAATELSIKGEKAQTFDNANELIKKLKEVYPDATISQQYSYLDVKSDLIERGDIAFVNVIGQLTIQPKISETVFTLTFNENVKFSGPVMTKFTLDGTPVQYEHMMFSQIEPQKIKVHISSNKNLLVTDSKITLSIGGVITEDGLAVPIENVVYVN